MHQRDPVLHIIYASAENAGSIDRYVQGQKKKKKKKKKKKHAEEYILFLLYFVSVRLTNV